MIKSKLAIILRGVPGSGKSTFVEAMKSRPGSMAIHAIDDLHVDIKGNFLWDEENAERLYTLNFANFVKSCASGIETVICDAINVEANDFQKYIENRNRMLNQSEKVEKLEKNLDELKDDINDIKSLLTKFLESNG